MIKAYSVDAIVLSRRNLGEADKLVTILTSKHGKKIVLAKGIRRLNSRRAAHLELFSHSLLMLRPSHNFELITEATIIESFSLVRLRLERIGYAYLALEMTKRLTAENMPSKVIYNQLLNLLRELNENRATRAQAAIRMTNFKENLLSELGFIDKSRIFDSKDLDQIIERILESKLKSPWWLTNIQSFV